MDCTRCMNIGLPFLHLLTVKSILASSVTAVTRLVKTTLLPEAFRNNKNASLRWLQSDMSKWQKKLIKRFYWRKYRFQVYTPGIRFIFRTYLFQFLAIKMNCSNNNKNKNDKKANAKSSTRNLETKRQKRKMLVKTQAIMSVFFLCEHGFSQWRNAHKLQPLVLKCLICLYELLLFCKWMALVFPISIQRRICLAGKQHENKLFEKIHAHASMKETGRLEWSKFDNMLWIASFSFELNFNYKRWEAKKREAKIITATWQKDSSYRSNNSMSWEIVEFELVATDEFTGLSIGKCAALSIRQSAKNVDGDAEAISRCKPPWRMDVFWIFYSYCVHTFCSIESRIYLDIDTHRTAKRIPDAHRIWPCRFYAVSKNGI